jgi:hypothetical protein
MSTPQASSNQGDPTDNESTVQEESELVSEPIECPNCGHEFEGTYCPSCGQEADPSVSATGVVGGFFRELVDIEHGFWPTFVGLTLRPGTVLRQYLHGVRKSLASPGRYLLAAVVVSVGVDRVLAWSGADPHPFEVETTNGSSATGGAGSGEGLGPALDAAMRTVDFALKGSQGRIIGYLLLTGLLALLLYRLFEDQFGRRGEALAVGTFLIGHLLFLTSGAELLYKLPASLYTGHPVDTSNLLTFAILGGYAGVACYGCFGPGWKAALKGVFAIVWGTVEILSVVLIGTVFYAAWLMHAHPDKYFPADFAGEPKYAFLAVAIGGVLFAIPLLLHASVEAYYRYW